MTAKRMSIWWIPVLIILAVGIGLAVALPLQSNFHEDCESRGGHVGPKNLCLTPDGRVIEK